MGKGIPSLASGELSVKLGLLATERLIESTARKIIPPKNDVWCRPLAAWLQRMPI
jgi:hypothetical protein